MYALIRTGGKQYRVQEGDELLIDRVKGNPGDDVEIGRLLFINDNGKITTEAEVLSQVKVKGTILEQTFDDKMIVFKYKAKTGYRRKAGHRQAVTRIKIGKINLPKKKTKPKAEAEIKE